MKTQKGFTPILIAIIAGIVLLAGGGAYYYSKQNKSPDFTNLMKGLSAKIPVLQNENKQSDITNNSTFIPDINNLTYSTGNGFEYEDIKLTNGKFKRGDSPATTSNFIDVSIVKSATGDINGDGKIDAMVITSTSLGNSPADTLYVVLNKDNPTPQIINVPLEEGNTVRSYRNVSIKDGKITIELDIMSPTDARCCPSIHETNTYILDGKNLKKILYNNANLDKGTLDWKTYTNEKYGFSFQYPVTTLETPIIKDDNNYIYINFQNKLNEKDIYQSSKIPLGTIIYPELSIGINDKKMIGFIYPDSYSKDKSYVRVSLDGSFGYMYVNENNSIYAVKLLDGSYMYIKVTNKNKVVQCNDSVPPLGNCYQSLDNLESRKIFEKILLTFKFTK